MRSSRKKSASKTAIKTSDSSVSTSGSADQRIVSALKNAQGRALTPTQLMGRAGFDPAKDADHFINTLFRLVGEGGVLQADNGKFKLPGIDTSKLVTGRLELTRDGSALVHVPGQDEPLIIPDLKSIQAFDGDEVEVLPTGSSGRAMFYGVKSFKQTEFSGSLEFFGKRAVFVPQQSRIKTEFRIAQSDTLGANPGDKVLVRLLRWRDQNPDGEVIRVLGASGDHQAEMHAIIWEYGLPQEFPAEVQADADAIPREIPAAEIARRRDFRPELTLTIDPADAKDFDDAISYKRLPNGNTEVGVHIADVTYYLQEGSILDREAYERATSVYLVDRTIPMLPEVLSNDLCSLRPLEDRLAFSAVFELDDAGNVHGEWYGRTIIHSKHRFSYEQAQLGLETGDGPYAAELQHLNRLAYALRGERFAGGSISFETEEVRFRLDEAGKPMEVYVKDRKDAHKLIEDFMLLANRKVAHFIAKKRQRPPIPLPYRIHPLPDADRLADLQNFVRSFGYDVDIAGPRELSTSLNKLSAQVEGRPEQNVIQQVAIRSMAKAIYTTKNTGHYGLGFEYYTHFTSPIRRYPDVMTHRVLQEVLDDKPSRDPVLMEDQCKHCSEREKRAADAERASIKYKQIEFLGGMLNARAQGFVSGVTEWGIYVELEGNKCEGMIPLRDMHDDHYEVDKRAFLIKGKRTGKVYRLGDPIKVQVKKINLKRRTADFALAKER